MSTWILCSPECAPNSKSLPRAAEKLELTPGIPVPVGAFDAHWDAIGAGIQEGDVVNVVGTSTCIMAIAKEENLIPGVCGEVIGSIHPDLFGVDPYLGIPHPLHHHRR